MTRIIDVNALEQTKDDSSKYAIFVNRRRMVPDVRDGLKTVHRRIMYSAFNDEHAVSQNRAVKSLAVVGTTLKKYHPHGDTAVYDAMKPLTNWFESYLPLLSKQGNFGTVQGDSASAPRYTETYLSEFGLECVIGELADDKQVVDWMNNYSDTALEPEYLAVKLPLLLINGSFGIGFGLKTEIPSHNTSEVIDATINLIKNPNADVVLVPDQCMRCDIIESNFKAISNKGNGSFRVRGIIDIEEIKGRPALVIKSTPNLVFLNTIKDSIEKMIKEKKLIQIVDAYDDEPENEHEMRYVYILKKGSDANFVREFIYKNTDMEKTFKVNFEVLKGLDPVRMSYKSYLQYFIEFRKMTKFRLYCNQLQKAKTKLHEKEPFIKYIQSPDRAEIEYMIESQTTIDDNYIIEKLISSINITDLQARYIINARTKEKSIAYLNKYMEEAQALTEECNMLLEKITNEDIIVKEIIDELKYYKKKYGKPRNCRVIKDSDISDIPKGEFKIVITENNFIKKVPVNDSIGSFRGDSPKIILKGDNTENILIFDEQGKVFKLPIHKIPFTDRSSNGTDIRTLIKQLTSNINKVIYEPVLKELTNKTRKYFVTVLTKTGYIKKLDLEDFLAVPPSGIIFIKLEQGDIVKGVEIIASDLDIIVYSKNKALRMNLSEVPHQKRNTKGLMAMAEETVDGLSIIKPDTTDVVVITENGNVNRFDIIALPNLGRNKSGSRIIKLAKTDSIKNVYGAHNTDTLKVTTKGNVYEFIVGEIPSGTSISAGSKLMATKNDNIIRCDIIRHKQ